MSRHVTYPFKNPNPTVLVPLFEYFPVLFAPEKAKEHRKYNEYIVYNKEKRVYEVIEPVDNILWEDGSPRLDDVYRKYDIPLQQCQYVTRFSVAPNLLCRN